MMHTLLAISFSTKGQDFDKIQQVLNQIKKEVEALNEIPILVHSISVASPEVSSALKSIFPLQLSCLQNGLPNRAKVAEILHEFGGEAYIIGDVISEEVQMDMEEYKKQNIHTKFIHLPLGSN